MKKIKTKSQEEKKQKRKQLIIGLILVFVMIASTFGIVMNSFGEKSNSNEIINYNGVEFIHQNNYWVFSIESYNFAILNNPQELEKFQFKGSKTSIKDLSTYVNLPLYIQSNDYYLTNIITQDFQPFVERIQYACLENNTDCPEDYPIKNCQNNFIIISYSENSTSLRQQDNCIFLEGNSEELVNLTDVFVLKTFRIRE
ncbi:MAG: hypothetical protein WC812_04690 [Candidatus Pacearchaeota archaeon]|jgi:flagellar basal body-associated protein FliL